VALACRLDESFAPAVKELVWMGGCSSARGNVTATSEFNAHKDPEAAHIVLSTFPRCTMVSEGGAAVRCSCSCLMYEAAPPHAHLTNSIPRLVRKVSWEVTVKHAVPWVIFDEFLEQCEASANPRGRFIKAISSPFLRDRERWEGAPICDAVAVAVALDRSIITASSGGAVCSIPRPLPVP
jgi:inosine-uridine nucleoside N-ribohydrolase